ncbi:MAG: hypothetical protein Q8Q97_01975 [bacterium]|nr:hypothetical protein [bacterium]
MNQRGFINIVWMVIIVALAGGLGYFIFKPNCELVSKPDLYECQSYFGKFVTSFQTPPSQPPTSTVPGSPGITENETANWEIYQSEKYKFEFKYPESFSFIKEQTFTIPTEGSLFILEDNALRLEFTVNPAGKGLEPTREYASKSLNFGGDNIKVNFLEIFDPNLTLFAPFFPENKFLVELRCKSKCDALETKAIFDKIISSIKSI